MSAGDLLLHRTDAGLDFLARWLELCERITPRAADPQCRVSGELPTVEAEALALVTTTEALHRTLYPDVRRFSERDVAESISALSTSTMPKAVRDSFTSALGTWWSDYSYPMRVRALAAPVAEAVPSDCIGKLSRLHGAVRRRNFCRVSRPPAESHAGGRRRFHRLGGAGLGEIGLAP